MSVKLDTWSLAGSDANIQSGIVRRVKPRECRTFIATCSADSLSIPL